MLELKIKLFWYIKLLCIYRH